VRKNHAKEFIPQRFEDGIARGRLWQYLNSPDKAFKAFNAAVAFAKDNFLHRIESHMAIHTLMSKERVEGRHREFFENFSAIGWYGHYTLPIGKQLQLTKEAIEFHGTLDRIDYPDPEASRKLADLYRITAWLHIQNLKPNEYFISAKEALQDVSSIHEMAMMLNRYMCLCHHWGITEAGIKSALMAITLCEEVPPELDCDLLSVNYAMGASLIADSNTGLSGRLSFVEKALENVHATERELVHTNLAYANTQTLLGRYDDAQTALTKAKITMDKKAMESVKIYYYQSVGLLHAAQNDWGTACAAYSRSLTAALWLDQKLEALRVGHNLLISYIQNNDFNDAKRLFPSVLRSCLTNASISNFDEAEAVLDELLNKSNHLLSQQSLSTPLSERMKIKADNFGLKLHVTSRQSIFAIVFHTATVLTGIFPQYFNMSNEVRERLKTFAGPKDQLITANSIACPMQKNEIAFHIIA
jgi:tetratricopeptide (TPR) repeat protein